MPAVEELPYKGDMVIGYEALFMPGMEVGNGAIISSRSVVTGDVPAYAIVGGNPAKVIKYRFNSETIAQLETIAWWNWPVEKISQNLTLIVSGDIDALASC